MTSPTRIGLAGGGRCADDSFAHRDAPVLDDFRAMADGEAEIHLVGAFFGKQDGENFVVDQALDLRRGGGKHFIQIQRGVDLLADLREDRQRLSGDFHFRIEFRESIC